MTLIPEDLLPDGSRFPAWEDRTVYSRVYHVAREHPGASDANPGSADRPLATIGRAAAIAAPGEKVVIHAGTYHECVSPAVGGTGADRMIAYEAAAGERVIVTGGEFWTPQARPSEGWGGTGPAWMADLPEEVFGAFNPFSIRNAYDYISYYGKLSDREWVHRAMLRRAMVFFEGKPLKQVYLPHELSAGDGAFWVEEPGLRIHCRLPGDRSPQGVQLEISAREQIFAPRARGLGFIRVSGLILRHAATGLPVPQRGALSANRGHHWIVEDCTVEWSNALGMDIGCQHWLSTVPAQTGGHIIRRNLVRHCGLCGLAGAQGVWNSLIEENTFEHIGHLNLSESAEGGAIKLHLPRNTIFRRNVFRKLHVIGMWLDCDAINCRISNNVFAEIYSGGGFYSEMNYEANLMDNNLFWDLRIAPGQPRELGGAGCAIYADCNEKMLAVHNFFGRVEGDCLLFALSQHDRRHRGRTGLCRANVALNNVTSQCGHRVHLGRREENRSDGNLFDQRYDDCSFYIGYPLPGTFQNLAGWREFFGLDAHSSEARVEAEFDVETLTLRWRIQGALPTCQPFALGAAQFAPANPGPFDPAQWALSLAGQEGRQVFPVRAPRG